MKILSLSLSLSLLFTLSTFPIYGAVALVQEQITTTGSSPAAVMDSNVTAGNTLHACYTFFDLATTTPTIADTRSSTWGAVSTNPMAVSGSQKLYCWIAYNISGGADTITVTCGGNCITGGLVVAEWSGTATSGATGSGTNCAGGNYCGEVISGSTLTPTSTSITTVNAGVVVSIYGEFSSGRTMTALTIFGSAATLFEAAGASGFGAEYGTGIGAASSGTASFTANGFTTGIMGTFSIEEPTAAAGVRRKVVMTDAN